MPEILIVIFTTHHLLFRFVARDGQFLGEPESKNWWSHRAIAAFTPTNIKQVTDTDAVHRNLAFSRGMNPYEIPDWDELYAKQMEKSIAAVEMAVRCGLPIYNAAFECDTAVCDDVIDWLNMVSCESHPMFSKLSRITWPQAVGHAKKWQQLQEVQRMAEARFVAGIQGTSTVLQIGKWNWLRLETVEAIRQEGVVMENCLIEGNHDDLANLSPDRKHEGLFSLRDQKGRSRATVLFLNGLTPEALGRRNRALNDDLKIHVEALIEHLSEA